MERRNLVLVGFMGSGKTTVGRIVAQQAGLDFVDSDAAVAARVGKPVAAIFAGEGEARFRQVESEVLAELARGCGQVIATGGGAVLDSKNRQVLRQAGLVVALTADTDTLWNRVRGCADRPLLAGPAPRERMEALFARRSPLYSEAEVVVETSGCSPEEVASRVHGAWLLANASASVEVELGARSYGVELGDGLLAAVGVATRRSNEGLRALVVTNPVVGGLYAAPVRASLAAVGYKVSIAEVPDGENAKTVTELEALYQAAWDAGLERPDVVVALGGGVVGDVAGLLAATYLRGVDFVQVPTTILAQVDSSVGGKVGINLAQGKNLVGAFYQPLAVLADPNVLRTLPVREVRSGLAEALKAGIIADPRLFTLFESGQVCLRGMGEGENRLALVEAIRRAVKVKADVVAADEREGGQRMVLNLGHTAGHAVEALTGFGPVRHGEAVGYGIAVAARIAQAQGLCPAQEVERIMTVLRRLGFAVRLPELPVPVSREAVMAGIPRDKKAKGGKVRWVLPLRAGEVTISGEVPEALVAEAL